MLRFMNNREVLSAIIDRYLQAENMEYIVNYGLMIVGICEKEEINQFLVEIKPKEMLK